MSRLQGKTALVTGGRQGIGRAIVGCFAAEGARVMTCGRGPRPADLPDTVLWQTADVADKADIDALTDRVVAEFGELSILVNNAGVQRSITPGCRSKRPSSKPPTTTGTC
jgi:NAD(P)-dependent dehydrogenase (short-subunit alcohol dehydrogenase family)